MLQLKKIKGKKKGPEEYKEYTDYEQEC